MKKNVILFKKQQFRPLREYYVITRRMTVFILEVPEGVYEEYELTLLFVFVFIHFTSKPE